MVNLTILVRDRLNLTRQTLDSLAQSGALEGNTLTIFDDRSLEPTKTFLIQWTNDHKTHLVRNDAPIGTGEARNQVVKLSEARCGRGDFLYLSDNDLCYSRDWLQNLTEWLQAAPWFSVVGAYNHPFNQPANTHWTRHNRLHEVAALSTQSMLMSWKTWQHYGPFCQTPVDRVCQSEDVELCQRIHADGGKVGVAWPWLAIGTGITNTFGQPIPGWELVKSQCPPDILCE